jgi:hypothetical protein
MSRWAPQLLLLLPLLLLLLPCLLLPLPLPVMTFQGAPAGALLPFTFLAAAAA